MSDKIVVIMAHSNLEESIVNKRIKKELEHEENVVYKDIMSLYKNYKIDVEKEQMDIVDAKKIIFQFPMYWYSAPSILKLWVDEVFAYGFVYEMDEKGAYKTLALEGKEFQIVISMGAKEESFSGPDRLSVKECLNSYSYTAKMLGMKELEPYFFYGAMEENGIEEKLDKMAVELKAKVL